MSFTTVVVQGTVNTPDGKPIVGCRVEARLASRGASSDGSTQQLVLGSVVATSNTAGLVSVTLIPNDKIEPPDSFYIVTFTTPDGQRWDEHWYVPSGVSPLAIGSVSLTN